MEMDGWNRKPVVVYWTQTKTWFSSKSLKYYISTYFVYVNFVRLMFQFY